MAAASPVGWRKRFSRSSRPCTASASSPPGAELPQLAQLAPRPQTADGPEQGDANDASSTQYSSPFHTLAPESALLPSRQAWNSVRSDRAADGSPCTPTPLRRPRTSGGSYADHQQHQHQQQQLAQRRREGARVRDLEARVLLHQQNRAWELNAVKIKPVVRDVRAVIRQLRAALLSPLHPDLAEPLTAASSEAFALVKALEALGITSPELHSEISAIKVEAEEVKGYYRSTMQVAQVEAERVQGQYAEVKMELEEKVEQQAAKIKHAKEAVRQEVGAELAQLKRVAEARETKLELVTQRMERAEQLSADEGATLQRMQQEKDELQEQLSAAEQLLKQTRAEVSAAQEASATAVAERAAAVQQARLAADTARDATANAAEARAAFDQMMSKTTRFREVSEENAMMIEEVAMQTLRVHDAREHTRKAEAKQRKAQQECERLRNWDGVRVLKRELGAARKELAERKQEAHALWDFVSAPKAARGTVYKGELAVPYGFDPIDANEQAVRRAKDLIVQLEDQQTKCAELDELQRRTEARRCAEVIARREETKAHLQQSEQTAQRMKAQLGALKREAEQRETAAATKLASELSAQAAERQKAELALQQQIMEMKQKAAENEKAEREAHQAEQAALNVEREARNKLEAELKLAVEKSDKQLLKLASLGEEKLELMTKLKESNTQLQQLRKKEEETSSDEDSDEDEDDSDDDSDEESDDSGSSDDDDKKGNV